MAEEQEPPHKVKSRALCRQFVKAGNAAEVHLRNQLILMTRLGCSTEELITAMGCLWWLEKVSALHESHGSDWQVVEGVDA